jgi:hypothetical protein
VSFAAITVCVASKRRFIVVYFFINSVRKLLDTPSYLLFFKCCNLHDEGSKNYKLIIIQFCDPFVCPISTTLNCPDITSKLRAVAIFVNSLLVFFMIHQRVQMLRGRKAVVLHNVKRFVCYLTTLFNCIGYLASDEHAVTK